MLLKPADIFRASPTPGHSHVLTIAAMVCLILTALLFSPGPGQADDDPQIRVVNISRIIVDDYGVGVLVGNDDPSISANGRYLAFRAYAPVIAAGSDIFFYDRQTGETKRVSVNFEGEAANGSSHKPCISADGRFIAFESWASDLVDGDNNETSDIFVHDLLTGETTRVSLHSDGTEANNRSLNPCLSADGRFVAFESWASNLVVGDNYGATDVFVHDRLTGETTRVSLHTNGTEGNGASGHPKITADGRFVAFGSSANNLVDNDNNGLGDIFVHDRYTGETVRVSLSSIGKESNDWSLPPFISPDGRYVVFFFEIQQFY